MPVFVVLGLAQPGCQTPDDYLDDYETRTTLGNIGVHVDDLLQPRAVNGKRRSDDLWDVWLSVNVSILHLHIVVLTTRSV